MVRVKLLKVLCFATALTLTLTVPGSRIFAAESANYISAENLIDAQILFL